MPVGAAIQDDKNAAAFGLLKSIVSFQRHFRSGLSLRGTA
jgi:hypothetical protein